MRFQRPKFRVALIVGMVALVLLAAVYYSPGLKYGSVPGSHFRQLEISAF